MDPEVLNFAQVAVIIVLLIGSLSTISMLFYRAILRAQRRGALNAPQTDRRLEQL